VPGDDPVDRAPVRAVQTPTPSVGQDLLGEAPGERVPASPQRGRAVELTPAGQRAGGIDDLIPVAGPRGADGIEVLQPEARRVLRRWQEAQAESVRRRSIRCRSVPAGPILGPSSRYGMNIRACI
jgi:hypothetical protein